MIAREKDGNIIEQTIEECSKARDISDTVDSWNDDGYRDRR